MTRMEDAAQIMWSIAAVVNLVLLVFNYIQEDTNGMIFNWLLALVSLLFARDKSDTP